MDDTALQPGFPAWQAAAVLTLAAVVVTAFAAVGVPAAVGGPVEAVPAMAGAVWSSLLVSVGLVAMAGPFGARATVMASFGASAFRMLFCLAAGWVGVLLMGWPGRTVGLALGVLYVPLMLLEVALVGRYLWAKDFPAPGPRHTPETVEAAP